jgi:hypothetical protein
MHGEIPEAEPDQKRLHVGGDARGRRPAHARMQDDEERSHHYRKEAKHADRTEPVEWLAAVTTITHAVR